MRSYIFRVAALAFGAALAILSLGAVDRLVVSHWAPPFRYLLPPESKITFRTTEFDWEANVNRLGLRDYEMDVARKRPCRILVVGDSFTFGFGVNLEQSWPKLLERSLRTQGCDAEVINAGAMGTATGNYAHIIEECVPVLRPDLVIVGVQQGDDFSQALPLDGPVRRPFSWRGLARDTASLICPHAFRAWKMRHLNQPIHADMRETWKIDAADWLRRMTPEQRQRYDALAPEIRGMFVSGNINAAWINLAVVDPQHYSRTMDLEKNRDRLEAMIRDLKRMQTTAEDNHARLMVCAVPFGCYVSQAQWEMTRKLGFEVHEDFLTADTPDEAIHQACSAAGVSFITLTDAFRDEASDTALYYQWDGHFNHAGNAAFARLLEPHVARWVGER